MRVLVSINGRLQVSEILEFEPINEHGVLLITAEGLLDIKITGIDASSADVTARELLRHGYADLSSYPAEYDEESEHPYECECACGAVIDLSDDDLFRGHIICPECGERLEFEIDDDASTGTAPTPPLTSNSGPADAKSSFSGLFGKKRKNNVPWED